MLVGRDDALELLDGMKAALAAGIGGAVLVEGEQGVGKTELLRTSLADESAYRLLWGAADELRLSVVMGAAGRLQALSRDAPVAHRG